MIDLEKIKSDRDRILKTAILEYRKGTKPYLTKELEKEEPKKKS